MAQRAWDAPKSEASRATIAVDEHVIERILRLKSVEVVIRAGKASRRYKAVKSDRPDDLVFQSVKTGAPIRDNIVLARHIKPAARKLGVGLGELASPPALLRHLDGPGASECQGCAGLDAAQPGEHDSGRLSASSS